MSSSQKVEVENINVPGHISRVDAKKYHAMRDVMLKVLPNTPPGLTAKEMLNLMKPFLPQDLWPEGAKSGWWQKTVQLDLEAKGILQRNPKSKPLRWWRTEKNGSPSSQKISAETS